MQLSPEFSLAVQCCRTNFAGAQAETVTLPSSGVDWAKFIDTVRFHRVEGLVGSALGSVAVPETVGKQLSMAALRIAAESLGLAAECGALKDRFAAASVPLLFLKGSTLAALAYRNPALKTSIDIDIFVDPADLAAAANLLRDAGYRQTVPGLSRPLADWHRRSKESVWVKDSTGMQIDLHTRPADNPHLVPSLSVHSPRQLVDIGSGLLLPTFAADELFAYLAVHGGTSSWFRLKWLCDFAAFLNSKDAAEIDHLYRRSQELGAGRCAAQGLLLADRPFATLARNQPLRDELQRDRAAGLLARLSFALLTKDPSEPTERLFGTLPLHLAPFLLMTGWRYKSSELLGQAGKLSARFGL